MENNFSSGDGTTLHELTVMADSEVHLTASLDKK
jgi:hypothetical protein